MAFIMFFLELWFLPVSYLLFLFVKVFFLYIYFLQLWSNCSLSGFKVQPNNFFKQKKIYLS